jgi:hypothetical protein
MLAGTCFSASRRMWACRRTSSFVTKDDQMVIPDGVNFAKSLDIEAIVSAYQIRRIS